MSQRICFVVSCLIAVGLTLPQAAEAKKRKKESPHVSEDESSVILLSKAEKLAQNSKLSKAIDTLSAIPIQSTYSDIVQFLQGSYYQRLAMNDKKKSAAVSHAKSALDKYFLLLKKHPDSSFLKKTLENIATTELFLAAQSEPVNLELMETAFERLRVEKKFYLITPDHLRTYGKNCKSAPSKVCPNWLRAYLQYAAKNSIEAKTIAEFFPDLEREATPSFPNSKEVTGYDMPPGDLQAFDEWFKKILSKDYSKAYEGLKASIERFPKSKIKNRFLYWMAYALELDEGFEEARPLYQQVYDDYSLTWYGILASWKLGHNPYSRYLDSPPLEVRPFPVDSFATPFESKVLTRAPLLYRYDLNHLARQDLTLVKGRETAASDYLLQLANIQSLTGAYLSSFDPIQKIINRQDQMTFLRTTLKLIFPIAQKEHIEPVSQAEGVDPVCVMSHVKQESGFEPDVMSVASATGLLQLMPGTAIEMQPSIRRIDLIDPVVSLTLGIKYFKRMLQMFNGNISLALAAYNAGPSNAKKWINQGIAGQSMEFFVEQIPFRETREYVTGIFRNYYFYKTIYYNDTLKDTSTFWPDLK